MVEIEIPYKFTPRGYQLELFQALDGVEGRPETRKRRAFLRWHRRAGKDLTCFCYMVKEACTTMGQYYYFFPTYAQGKKALWEYRGEDKSTGEPFKMLDKIPASLIKSISHQEMRLELYNQSIIRIIGTEDVDKVRGVNPIGCVFSEYAEQLPTVYDVIRPILSENGGWAIFNGTPKGRNHFYELEMAIKNNPDWYVSELQTRWSDRPNFSGIVSSKIIQADIDSGMTEEMADQEYGVSYTAGLRGAIYFDQIEKARKEGRIGSYPYDNRYPVFTYWDLGYNDPTAIWFVQFRGSSVVLFDYWEGSRVEIPDIAQILLNKGYKYSTHFLPHDGNQNFGLMNTRAQLLEKSLEYYDAGGSVSVQEKKYPLQDGLNAVQSIFSTLCFNEGLCTTAIDMLGRYHRRYDEKRGVFLNEPVHDWCSHCADALRTLALSGDLDPITSRDIFDIKVKSIGDYNVFDRHLIDS